MLFASLPDWVKLWITGRLIVIDVETGFILLSRGLPFDDLNRNMWEGRI